MTSLFAQSGLFQISIVFLYVVYGLPSSAAIALAAAIVGSFFGRGGGTSESRKPTPIFVMFIKIFRTLALIGAALVVIACVWAQFAIGPR